MPNLNTTRSHLETAFINGWGTTTPISYDNVNYQEVSGESYVRISIEFVDSSNVCIGGSVDGTKRQRHIGLVKLMIYTPINEGSGSAYTLADTYKTIMDNKTINTDLYTGTTDVIRSGENVDGYYSLLCLTEFTSDE